MAPMILDTDIVRILSLNDPKLNMHIRGRSAQEQALEREAPQARVFGIYTPFFSASEG